MNRDLTQGYIRMCTMYGTQDPCPSDTTCKVGWVMGAPCPSDTTCKGGWVMGDPFCKYIMTIPEYKEFRLREDLMESKEKKIMDKDKTIEVSQEFGDLVTTTPNEIEIIPDHRDMTYPAFFKNATDEELVDRFKDLYGNMGEFGSGLFGFEFRIFRLIDWELDDREIYLKPIGVALNAWIKKVNAEEAICYEEMEKEIEEKRKKEMEKEMEEEYDKECHKEDDN